MQRYFSHMSDILIVMDKYIHQLMPCSSSTNVVALRKGAFIYIHNIDTNKTLEQ